MSVINLKLKNYDELIFEITTLNTNNYLLQQKVEQLENIRKEAIEYINHAQNYGTMTQVMPHLKPYVNGDDLLNILNKGSEE